MASIEPIPFFVPPEMEGIKCKACRFVARSRQRVQEHCRRQHRRHIPWKRGESAHVLAQQPREVPWVEGVQCQQFSPSRNASAWFEVAKSEGRHSEEDMAAPVEDPVERVKRLHREQASRFKAKAVGKVQVGDDKTEPNG